VGHDRGRFNAHDSYGYTLRGKGKIMLRLILIILLVLFLLGSLPTWPYSTGWGYYPSGGLGLLLIIVVVLIFMDVV